jgi:hypothetical protein
MNWDEERRAILHGNRIGAFNPWELAYGETVLTACQEAMLAPFLAPGLLDGLDQYDQYLLRDLARAITEAPIPDQDRKSALHGALKMAHAYLWSKAPRPPTNREPHR